jgi:predicted dinucleotide-binding enzyme
MKIGIIGSGNVAQTLGGKLLELGHAVTISSRDSSAEKPTPWGTLPSADAWSAAQREQGRQAAAGSVAETAAFGDLLINATSGAASLDALATADRGDIEGKIMIDLSNPLDFSQGMPPSLAFCNTDSLGESIQAAYPGARVVKALNTVSVAVMIAPRALPEETDLIVCGNDAGAKAWVVDEVLKKWLGWTRVIDLGDISNARGTEMYLPLWVRLFGLMETPLLNIKVVTAS